VTSGILLIAAAIGLVGGAALPLPVYRLAVPWAAGEARRPVREACGSCRQRVPGWLRLGGRCPGCAVRLGPPTWLLAALGGLGAAGLAWRIGPHAELVPYLFGVLAGLLLGTVDWLSQRLPDRVVYPGIAIAVVLFGGVALVDDEFAAFGRALAAGAVLFAVYLLMALLPGAAIGGGDLGLAAFAGLFLGWVGWPVVVLGAALPWLLQAVASVVALVRRRAGRATMLAFGPALLAGAYVVLLVTV
jgi:leader peptidase (prepilin peptidase) / N-methyltransferase